MTLSAGARIELADAEVRAAREEVRLALEELRKLEQWMDSSVDDTPAETPASRSPSASGCSVDAPSILATRPSISSALKSRCSGGSSLLETLPSASSSASLSSATDDDADGSVMTSVIGTVAGSVIGNKSVHTRCSEETPFVLSAAAFEAGGVPGGGRWDSLHDITNNILNLMGIQREPAQPALGPQSLAPSCLSSATSLAESTAASLAPSETAASLAPSTVAISAPFIPKNPCQLIQNTFMNESTADVAFEVGDGRAQATFYAHRALLQKRAPALADLCGAEGAEGRRPRRRRGTS